MSQKPNTIAIIPARGGSKSIPRKNIRLLAGKPLIAYTIAAALGSNHLARVVLSTDDEEIAGVARSYGAGVIMRPAELATDTSPTIEASQHVVRYLSENEGYQADVIALLQPTSPLRNSRHIDEALEMFFRDGYDSLLSVCPSHAFVWRFRENQPYPVNYDFRNRPRRQDSELEYRENGAIYITRQNVLMGEHNHLGGRIGLYVMAEEASPEIDTEYDFWLCEQIISSRSR